MVILKFFTELSVELQYMYLNSLEDLIILLIHLRSKIHIEKTLTAFYT